MHGACLKQRLMHLERIREKEYTVFSKIVANLQFESTYPFLKPWLSLSLV